MSGWVTAAAVLIAGAAAGTTSNMNAIKARQEAGKQSALQLEAAKAAADKSKAATATNTGDVSLQSDEDLQDEAIRSKSTKNRLRVDKVSSTGLSLGGSSSSSSATGVSI